MRKDKEDSDKEFSLGSGFNEINHISDGLLDSQLDFGCISSEFERSPLINLVDLSVIKENNFSLDTLYGSSVNENDLFENNYCGDLNEGFRLEQNITNHNYQRSNQLAETTFKPFGTDSNIDPLYQANCQDITKNENLMCGITSNHIKDLEGIIKGGISNETLLGQDYFKNSNHSRLKANRGKEGNYWSNVGYNDDMAVNTTNLFVDSNVDNQTWSHSVEASVEPKINLNSDTNRNNFMDLAIKNNNYLGNSILGNKETFDGPAFVSTNNNCISDKDKKYFSKLDSIGLEDVPIYQNTIGNSYINSRVSKVKTESLFLDPPEKSALTNCVNGISSTSSLAKTDGDIIFNDMDLVDNKGKIENSQPLVNDNITGIYSFKDQKLATLESFNTKGTVSTNDPFWKSPNLINGKKVKDNLFQLELNESFDVLGGKIDKFVSSVKGQSKSCFYGSQYNYSQNTPVIILKVVIKGEVSGNNHHFGDKIVIN